MRKLLFITAVLLLTAPAARAEVPIPPRKQESLAVVQEKLDRNREKEAALESSAKKLKKQLEDTRGELVDIAAAIRGNEGDLTALEDRVAALTAEQENLTARLEKDYGSIGGLIIALERMRRTPPEALIVRPGAPLQTAQTAMLMQSVLPAVTHRAEKLTADLDRLRTIRETLDSDRAEMLATRKELENRRTKMAGLIKQREQLYNETESDRAQTARTVRKLAGEARNLRDLMTRLAEEEKARAARRAAAPAATGRAVNTTPVSLPGLGKAQVPAQGRLTVAYGQPDGFGAQSEGITIESRPRAIVVAPMGGVVRFAGEFKNYGKMIIIEHKKEYHSLIAGLERVDVQVGDRLQAGEPVGNLPASSSRGGQPGLYYELRQNGRPVDPSSTFSGLKS
jgi:septal ring factor EnvC (AmiA/AmiB activator)